MAILSKLQQIAADITPESSPDCTEIAASLHDFPCKIKCDKSATKSHQNHTCYTVGHAFASNNICWFNIVYVSLFFPVQKASAILKIVSEIWQVKKGIKLHICNFVLRIYFYFCRRTIWFQVSEMTYKISEAERVRAVINVGVLTPFFQETAINVAYSCRLLDNNMQKVILNAKSTVGFYFSSLVYSRSRLCGISALRNKMPPKIYVFASNGAHKIVSKISTYFLK